MRALAISFVVGLALVLVAAAPSSSENPAAEAEHHLRKACEIVWSGSHEYQIERCTKRAMAAMGDENRLRDNELKRLLMSSERELETCKKELMHALGAHADVAAVRHEPEPR